MADVDLTVYYKDGCYLQCNESTTNLFLNSLVPATQGITVTATKHILWMNDTDGLGSVSCSYGTATAAAPLIFTSSAETITFTVTGAENTLAQLETGDYKGPFISTEGTPVTIGPTTYTFPAANISPEAASISIDIEYESGLDADILTIGALKLLSISSGNLVLGDGTNAVVAPITKGQHSIQARWGEGGMSLVLNGNAPVTGPYLPFTQADIILSMNAYDFSNGERPHDVPSETFVVNFEESAPDFVFSTSGPIGTCVPADYNGNVISYIGSLGETTMRIDMATEIVDHSTLQASMLGDTALLTWDGTGYAGTWPTSIWDKLSPVVSTDVDFTIWPILNTP